MEQRSEPLPRESKQESSFAFFFDTEPRTLQEQSLGEEAEEDEVVQPEPLRMQTSSEGGHEAEPVAYQLPRKIHIYFSDTGGGHRASALALEAALEKQYGSQVSVELIDFFRAAMPWPLSQAPETYQTLGNFPSVYKRAWDYDQDSETWQDTTSYQWMWSYSKEHIVKYLQPLDLDLVISVHPLIHHLVIEALEEISRGSDVPREEIRLPVVTVVTDLGSAHLSWFDPRVDLLFVPSQEIYQLAVKRCVPKQKINLSGLPLREGFWSADPIELDAKKRLQEQLGLRPTERPEVVLLMGGGEGFGRLNDVACAIGDTLISLGYGQLVVVCGRNEEVRKSLSERRWMNRQLGEWLFEPQILGFVKNIDEYMTAADCLVTKAGPGSIAEGMIKGLPCLLTAFVPGQEEGNIGYVTDNGAGAYVPDEEPEQIAEKIAEWLSDPAAMKEMSENARRLAKPAAALQIARRICDGLLDLGVELKEVKASDFAPSRRELLLQRKEKRQAKRRADGNAHTEATAGEQDEDTDSASAS